MDYLLKTEPSTYSFADLQRDKTTVWDGVSNPVALKNLRNMKPGERLVIYHTGDEKSAVGTATVVSVDTSDEKNPQVKIKVGRANAKPVTLAEAKANQKAIAEKVKAEAQKLWPDPIVTEIAPLDVFYKAEDYHQDYFAKNPEQGYCRVVVAPKVKKFEKLLQEQKR